MPPRNPLCPYVVATVPGAESAAAELTALPGVKVKGASVTIPHHAIPLAHGVISRAGLPVASARWALPAATSQPAWPEVEPSLRANGAREFLFDGFLTDYQKDAVCFGFNRFGVHYWHTTGAGKTLTALLFALSADNGPIVIVTRAASRLQYGREVERFTTLRPYVVRPAAAMKKGALTLAEYCADTSSRRVVVVGWESLADHIEPLVALRPGCVIFDEAHKAKSNRRFEAVPLPETDDVAEQQAQAATARSRGGFITQTETSRIMMVPTENMAASAARLARASKRRACTTATPVKDRVRDLWSQLDLAEPDAWGNATVWMNRYCDRKPGTYGGFDTTGASNVEELADRLTYVVHRVEYAVTHRSLPPKRRQSVYVAPEDQCKPTGSFQKELNEASKRGPSAVMEVELALAASKKRKAVVGLVEDHLNAGQKVIIFTGRRRDCEELGKSFKGTKAQVWSSHGGDSTATRQQVVDDYMAHPGPCLLVGTGDAFGEALNLHDTDALLFVMLPWTPGQVRQWEGRVARLGQKRPVTIYYVIAEGTVDEHVASLLIDKMPAVESIAGDKELGAARSVIAGTEDEEKLVQGILDKLFASEGEGEGEDE
jgi:superfamily II DNA or RNA helicase